MRAPLLIVALLSLAGASDCSWFGGGDDGSGPPTDAAVDASSDAAPGDAAPTCDPNGTWNADSAATYTCCGGAVTVQVDQVTVEQDGQVLRTAPFSGGDLMGDATTCPGGGFDNAGSTTAAGCTVSLRVVGAFDDPDVWSGSVELGFEGSACICAGADPCVDQSMPVTMRR